MCYLSLYLSDISPFTHTRTTYTRAHMVDLILQIIASTHILTGSHGGHIHICAFSRILCLLSLPGSFILAHRRADAYHVMSRRFRESIGFVTEDIARPPWRGVLSLKYEEMLRTPPLQRYRHSPRSLTRQPRPLRRRANRGAAVAQAGSLRRKQYPLAYPCTSV